MKPSAVKKIMSEAKEPKVGDWTKWGTVKLLGKTHMATWDGRRWWFPQKDGDKGFWVSISEMPRPEGELDLASARKFLNYTDRKAAEWKKMWANVKRSEPDPCPRCGSPLQQWVGKDRLHHEKCDTCGHEFEKDYT